MFAVGDKVFVICTNSGLASKSVKIEQRTVLGIESKEKIRVDAGIIGCDVMINSWAIAKTYDEANKIALTFIIHKEEWDTIINSYNTDDYEKLLNGYPDLIFKYADSAIGED